MTSTLIASFASGSSVSMLLLLLKATLILLVALGITLSMQRTSAGARHLVWLVTLATLLLVPVLTAWGPIPLRILPPNAVVRLKHAAVHGDNASPKAIEEQLVAPAVVLDQSQTDAAPPASFTNEIASSPVLSGLSIVVLLWAAVVLIIAGSLAYAAMLVKRIVNRAHPLISEDWMTPLWEVSDRLGLEEPPRLLRSEDAKMPFACGVFTPTIVLPAESDKWSLDRRRAVLLHELAHVRRHDLIGHTLGRLACALYWFHPLVWTAAKRLRSESERACDDLALACGARAADYAEHLLDIVTSVRGDATPSVALAMARRKEFEGRMLAILDPELRHSSPSRRQSATLIGSLALIAIVVGAAAPSPRIASESSQVASDATPNLELATQQPSLSAKDSDKNFEPSPQTADGPVIEHMHTVLSQHTVTRQSTTTSQSIASAAAAGISSSLPAVIDAGVAAGMEITKNTLLGILGKQGASKDSDERPVLLARILASDTSASLRRIAAWGLNEYADRQVAAEALANALRHDRDARVREMAAWSLADADHFQPAIDALAAALRSDASIEVRKSAAWALGNIGDRSSVDALAAALSDPNQEIRERSAWALGNIDMRAAPPQLIALLNDKDAETRETAAWALYQIEDPAAIPALENALAREQNKELQLAYIRALAATGEKSVDALKSLLDSKDPEIRNIAVRALAGGHATGPWPRPRPEPRPFPDN